MPITKKRLFKIKSRKNNTYRKNKKAKNKIKHKMYKRYKKKQRKTPITKIM